MKLNHFLFPIHQLYGSKIIKSAITFSCHCHSKGVHLKSAEFFGYLQHWASKAINNKSISLLLYATKGSQQEISSIISLMKDVITSVYLAVSSLSEDLHINKFGCVSLVTNNRTWSRVVRNLPDTEELTDSLSDIYMLSRLKNDFAAILTTRFTVCCWYSWRYREV